MFEIQVMGENLDIFGWGGKPYSQGRGLLKGEGRCGGHYAISVKTVLQRGEQTSGQSKTENTTTTTQVPLHNYDYTTTTAQLGLHNQDYTTRTTQLRLLLLLLLLLLMILIYHNKTEKNYLIAAKGRYIDFCVFCEVHKL